jgi:hypothetical protein
MPSFTFTRTPTETYTVTYTKTSTPVPGTETPTSIATLIPTQNATPDVFKINDTLAYPDPYFIIPQSLYFSFYVTQACSSITLRIYTAAYRLILKEDMGACQAGRVVKTVATYYLGQLASGTYYYLITGESLSGEKANSKPDVILIIK